MTLGLAARTLAAMQRQMDEKEAIKKIIETIQQENDGEHIDYIIPGYAANKVIGYQSMRHDLMLCKDAIIKLLKDDHNETISSALFYTFIALYGKCFTDASSSKSPKFDRTDFSKDHQHLLDTHNEIMDMRHNFVAHRGSTQHEIGFAYLKLNTKDYSRQVRVKQIKRTGPKPENLSKYIELLDYLIALSEKKFYDAGVKVWDHMLKEYPPDMMAGLKLSGPTQEEE